MTLGDMADALRDQAVDAPSAGLEVNASISAITYDSRRVVPGSVFVALKGLRADGGAFAAQAAQRGALAIVSESARPDSIQVPWLTVRGNVQTGPTARGLLPKMKQEVESFIRLVGLENFADAYPHHLSGGMAQRAALARALINHPEILLLDEPLGALDAFTRMRMQDEVLRLWQARRTTMLFVTHDIDEAIYMSDSIVIMTPRPGRIEEIIPVALDRPRDRSSPEFLHLRARILKMLHFAGE